jgi:hypothetical protein
MSPLPLLSTCLSTPLFHRSDAVEA